MQSRTILRGLWCSAFNSVKYKGIFIVKCVVLGEVRQSTIVGETNR